MTVDETLLATALRIRAFEYKLLDLFAQGQISGTVHTCVGQELCAVALKPFLKDGLDAFFASHRGHGFFLAYGGPEDALFAEMLGTEGALCQGCGGTQHLQYQRFFSNGIQGAGALHATGFAWAMKQRGENGIAIAQIGDGTLGEGALYEAFTFAVLLKVPVLFLLEHNGYAQSTDTGTTVVGDLLERARGFGLAAARHSDTDFSALVSQMESVVQSVRQGNPFLQIIDTRRLLAHSKGDDDRPAEILERQWQQDPLAQLLKSDSAWQKKYQLIQEQIDAVVKDVTSRERLAGVKGNALPASARAFNGSEFLATQSSSTDPIVRELNKALHRIMQDRSDVIAIGEDIKDPYGGAFKVTRGLSTAFPDRVFSTPISEAAIIGISNGLALAGFRPVAEIMFADFLALASDQLINSVAKAHFMYGGKVTCPLTCRIVTGGGRGYGPTHSQSLETLLCGIPGLRIVALSRRHDAGRLLESVILDDEAPTIFVEHKSLYPQRAVFKPPAGYVFADHECKDGNYPPLVYQPMGSEKADVTLVTYGGMTNLVEEVMEQLLLEEELACDYLVITQLWPLDVDPVVESVRRTRKLVVIEEHTPEFGFSAAVIAAVSQSIDTGFSSRAVGAKSVPLPAVKQLENEILPGKDRIKQAIMAVCERTYQEQSG
jgi:2-oxoisovalerate dehydrogenase E1 component